MTDEKQHDLDDLRSQYKDFLNSDELEKLELELQKPNIFSILKISRKELKHSNFLRWLLDPNGSHSLENKFLVRILRDLALESRNDLNIVNVSNLNFNNVDIYREYSFSLKDNEEKGYIDILIDFKDEKDKLVICIEDKIDTIDSPGQLSKYKKFIDSDKNFSEYTTKLVVYLTPYGTEPNDTNEASEWHTYSYTKIIEHLGNIQNSITDSIVKIYISDYLSTLKREIMGTNDEARELANTIYKNHQPIIDFIVNNKESNKEYQNYWEDNHTFVLGFVNNLIELIEEFDKTNEYELEFMEKQIKIKQKNKTQNKFTAIYYIYKGAGSNCNMEFNFSSKENEKGIRNSVKEIVNKYNSTDLKCSDATYFKILGVNILREEELQEIHKLRFDIQ